MASPGAQNEAPYSSKKQLADLGLGQKEMPTTGAVRAVRPTGRPPAGPAGLPAQAAAPASPQGPTPDEHDLMVRYAEAAQALQTAQAYAQLPGAGAWAQFFLQVAQRNHDEAGLALNNGTANFQIEG